MNIPFLRLIAELHAPLFSGKLYECISNEGEYRTEVGERFVLTDLLIYLLV